MQAVFTKTAALTDIPTKYCPGCTHGIIHRLVAEVLDEFQVTDRAVGIAPVGCSVLAYRYFECDMQQAAHGRAPAVATGIKRSVPDSIVFTYQGDGDLASIGAAEIVHAAARGEKITVIFVNNAIYGMTGGQMAPTTLIGQKTTTSPFGRSHELTGYPIRVSEMLSTLTGAKFVARTSIHNPVNVNKTREAIRKAFDCQIKGLGFSMVEILSACPTNWGMAPVEAIKWVEEKMVPYYPLGVYRTPEEVPQS